MSREVPHKIWSQMVQLDIYFACLSVCPFVSNKRQNDWIDRAKILCGTSNDLREGL